MAEDLNSTVEPMEDEAHPLGEPDSGSNDAPTGSGEPPGATSIPQSASTKDLSNEPTITQHPVGRLSSIIHIPQHTG